MPEALRKFPRFFQIYAWVEVLGYLAIAIWVLPHSHGLFVVGLTIIFVAAGAIPPVPHPFGGISHPAIGVMVVAALLWDPQDVLLGVGTGSFIGLLLFRKNELWRAATNGAGWGLPAAAAALAAHKVISATSSGIAPLAIAAVLAVAVIRVTNTGIFAIFRSLRFGRPFLPDWRQSIVFQWPSQLLSAPLAVVLASIASHTDVMWVGLGLTAAYIVALPVARQEYDYYNRARQMLDETVEAVVRALEGTDPATRAHGDRVSALAVQTGRRLGLSERELLALRLASRLHDVGLLAGPEELSTEDTRAAVGGRILAQFPDPMAGEFVRAHHERWDGGGVPDNRRGKAIPLGARILAAAETYDSVRAGLGPFAPLSSGGAAAYLKSLAGNVLDPKVVTALLGVARERETDNRAVPE